MIETRGETHLFIANLGDRRMICSPLWYRLWASSPCRSERPRHADVHSRARGERRADEGGHLSRHADRLRPVIMTALVTSLEFVPLAPRPRFKSCSRPSSSVG